MTLAERIYAGERITPEEALSLFDWGLLELGQAADARRRLVHPDDSVGFILDRIINYTNICEAKCRFCAFHARAGMIEPYEMTIDEILARAGELAAIGGTQVMLQGGLHPDYTLDRYLGMIRAVREAYPSLYLHSFSPAEAVHMARRSGLDLPALIGMLKAAGLDSMPGASDLLVDRVRRDICPHKIMRDDWVAVMRALAAHGMGSSATMTYGVGETLAERVEHFDVIRRVQDETGVIRAFIPWSFSPKNTELSAMPQATGIDYLKIVAIARIYLDNVRYIQAGWLTEGLKLAQVALAMGANDMGGVLMEEVVVHAAGIRMSTNRDELVAVIKNAGRVPVQRDSTYQSIRSYA